MKKIVAVVILAVMAMTGLGCVALSALVTPGTIDQKAVGYAVAAGVADANDYTGYRNLAMARRLEADVSAAYEVNTLHLQQLQEKNELDYSILNEVVTRNVKTAELREDLLFSETGLLSTGLAALGVGGLGGFLGLMRKRPGDVSRAEMDTALADAGVEMGQKEQQLAETVLGVQAFLNTWTGGKEAGDRLKSCLSQAQSTETKKAVAILKTV